MWYFKSNQNELFVILVKKATYNKSLFRNIFYYVLTMCLKLLSDKFFSTEWYIKQQEIEEQLLLEQINKQNEEENAKWIEAEKIAIAQWKRLQEEKQRAIQLRAEQEAKMRLVSTIFLLIRNTSLKTCIKI